MMYAYLIAMIAVFVICYLAYRSKPEKYADLMGVSALLALVFFVNNLLVILYGFPDALLASPVLDCFLAVMIYRAWLRSREKWKVVVVASLVAQLTLHVAAIAMWKSDQFTQHGLYLYVVAVNGFFIVQLAALGIVGAGHGLDRLISYLFSRGGTCPLSDAMR
jgi:ABC-type long-subunit fatty acid transport system fused permease/ATPase subunit